MSGHEKNSAPTRGFWASILQHLERQHIPLIDLAREADRWAAIRARSNAEVGSKEDKALVCKLLDCRTALVQGEPRTDLDLLMLVFAGRQAVRSLRLLPLEEEYDGHRTYWFEELESGLLRMQALFEGKVGHSVDDLGFTVKGGTSMN